MFSDFTFWLMQQPKEIQFCWYLFLFIMLVVGLIYSILQEPREE